jgi:hypothetical protein
MVLLDDGMVLLDGCESMAAGFESFPCQIKGGNFTNVFKVCSGAQLHSSWIVSVLCVWACWVVLSQLARSDKTCLVVSKLACTPGLRHALHDDTAVCSDAQTYCVLMHRHIVQSEVYCGSITRMSLA